MSRAPSSKLPAFTFGYSGQTGSLYGLWLKNVLLSIVTLGIYSFWGRAAMRKYIVSCFNLRGLPFQYLGTGGEMFRGFLKILPFYIAFLAAIAGIEHFAGKNAATGAGALLVFCFILPWARFNALKYRVSRLVWTGIRGNMEGSGLTYALFHLVGTLKILFTLGLLSPSVDLDRCAYRISRMTYGDLRPDFAPAPSRLARVNIVTLLLALPTLFLSRLWYRAALCREAARATSLNGVRFKLKVTGGEMLGLFLGNLFIILLTLGLGIPFAIQRKMRFLASHAVVGGDMNALRAGQKGFQGAGTAEGMADAWDLGGVTAL